MGELAALGALRYAVNLSAGEFMLQLLGRQMLGQLFWDIPIPRVEVELGETLRSVAASLEELALFILLIRIGIVDIFHRLAIKGPQIQLGHGRNRRQRQQRVAALVGVVCVVKHVGLQLVCIQSRSTDRQGTLGKASQGSTLGNIHAV